jgi:acyl dehydratase
MTVNIGDDIPEWDMPSVKRERMRTMAAILRDPNPVHWDDTSTGRYGFEGKTINQGPLGLSYMVNMLHDWAGTTSIRRFIMTFPQAVLSEDHVIARGKVTGLRTEGDETIAECDIWLHNDERGTLLKGSAEVCLPA